MGGHGNRLYVGNMIGFVRIGWWMIFLTLCILASCLDEKQRATLIVDEIIRVGLDTKSASATATAAGGWSHFHSLVPNERHVPKDCWIDTVKLLEQSFLSLSSSSAYEHNYEGYEEHEEGERYLVPPPSASAKFCSSMDILRKQAMALGLTKCHFQTSGLSRQFPEKECALDQIVLLSSHQHDSHSHRHSDDTSATAMIHMQSCLSRLDQTAFLVYSQFFTHTEMLCIKLTEDMRMHRKEEILDLYEKKLLWMDDHLGQLEALEHKALERYEQSTALVLDQFGDVVTRMMEEKVMDMERMENVTRDLGQNIEKTISMTITSAMRESTVSFWEKVYGETKMNSIRSMLSTLADHGLLGWHTLYMWGRYCFIFIFFCIPTMLAGDKFGRCRRLVCIGSLLELAMEHLCHYLVAVETLTEAECEGWIAWMRSYDLSIYAGAMVMSWVRWALFGGANVRHATACSCLVCHDRGRRGPQSSAENIVNSSGTNSKTSISNVSNISSSNSSHATMMTMMAQMNQVLDEITKMSRSQTEQKNNNSAMWSSHGSPHFESQRMDSTHGTYHPGSAKGTNSNRTDFSPLRVPIVSPWSANPTWGDGRFSESGNTIRMMEDDKNDRHDIIIPWNHYNPKNCKDFKNQTGSMARSITAPAPNSSIDVSFATDGNDDERYEGSISPSWNCMSPTAAQMDTKKRKRQVEEEEDMDFDGYEDCHSVEDNSTCDTRKSLAYSTSNKKQK